MKVVGDLEGNGFLESVTKIWCGVFIDIETEKEYQFKPHQMEEMKAFLSKCEVIIGHNWIDYDEAVLKKVLDFTYKAEVIDTYILSQMLEPDRRKHPRCPKNKGAHSLANFGCIFKRYKPDHTEWDKFSNKMLHRCSEDVHINFLAFKMMNRKANIFNKKSIWYKPYRIEKSFARCIVKQKQKGFLVDRDKIERNIDFFTDEMNKISEEVVPKLPLQLIINEGKEKNGEYKFNKKPFKGDGNLNKHTVNWCNRIHSDYHTYIGGPFSRITIQPFNIDSRKLVVEYLLKQGWVPEAWNTVIDKVTGLERRSSPKLSKDDHFYGVKGEVGQKVSKRMVLKHRRSQLEGFLKIIRDDGRITAGVSGMTPTVRLKHKGIVNIPNPDSGAIYAKEMREPFIAPPGYMIVGVDAASCQLRNLCHHMGDDEYTEAVVNGDKEKGTDVHSVNMKKTGIIHRSKAKNFIYGFLFGAGNAKIGAILGKDTKAGKETKDRFLSELPKLKSLLDKLAYLLDSRGYIVGLDGRHIYPRSPHEALCYLLQSDEAILMKVATILAHKRIAEKDLDAVMVCHMHDEYQWEVKEDQVDEVAKILENCIRDAGEFFNMNVPMAGEAAVGRSWAETH